MQLSKESPIFDRSRFDSAAKFIHGKGGMTPEDLNDNAPRELLEEVHRSLSEAVEKGIAAAQVNYEIPETTLTALRENVWVFSGMKTWHELKEASQMLVAKDGQIKSFDEFLRDIQKTYEAYNENYLRAEYGFAVRSAQIAARWNDYEQDGDDYNLQYRTAGDDKVRADHATLNGTTLPLSDPFWNSYVPPLDWGCRCTVVQVRKDKYPESDSEAAQESGKEATTRIGKDGSNKLAMFRFNPGKDLKIFPGKHPYFARSNSPQEVKEAQKTVEEMAKKPKIRTVEDLNKYFSGIAEESGWFERGFKAIKTEMVKWNNGSTDMDGNIMLKPEIKNNVISAIDKLISGNAIAEKEAEAIGTFWHEVTHNRNKFGNMILNKNQRQYMELANEFVARNTLGEFYGKFGVKNPFPQFEIDRASTGYNRMVKNYALAIHKVGLNKADVLDSVRKRLFEGPYTQQQKNLQDALQGAKKADGSQLKRGEIIQIVQKSKDLQEDVFERYINGIIQSQYP
ncbi:MAG: minor capsid protein [Dysgonamonadaceae bacterium]|jgi:SPP1 gp7 family putative phage head morphogenesis protein|nr:minor capsid protein [Dysgonamonadaceae bacterium]